MFYDTGPRGRSTKSCLNNCFSNSQPPSRQCWVILSTCNFLSSPLSQPPKIIPKSSDLTLPHPIGHVDKSHVTINCIDIMSLWPNATLTKCHSTKCHIAKMPDWQNATLTKCRIDKMSCWHVKLTKCQVDKMSSQQNVTLTKCLSTFQPTTLFIEWSPSLTAPSNQQIHLDFFVSTWFICNKIWQYWHFALDLTTYMQVRWQ